MENMKWNGEKLRYAIFNARVTKTELAKKIGTFRQTVYAWIEGQEPRGLYLAKLSLFFGVAADYFFKDDE